MLEPNGICPYLRTLVGMICLHLYDNVLGFDYWFRIPIVYHMPYYVLHYHKHFCRLSACFAEFGLTVNPRLHHFRYFRRSSLIRIAIYNYRPHLPPGRDACSMPSVAWNLIGLHSLVSG